MLRPLCAVGLAIAICLSTGCGDGSVPPPDMAPVSGKVNLDGKPMSNGAVRFNVAGFAPVELAVSNGTFSGDVYIGKNVVDVVSLKEGEPSSTDPAVKMSINVVDARFSGPSSPLQPEIPAEGKSDLVFDVTSAR